MLLRSPARRQLPGAAWLSVSIAAARGAPTLRQNSLPTWLPHWPTWMLMISRGMLARAHLPARRLLYHSRICPRMAVARDRRVWGAHARDRRVRGRAGCVLPDALAVASLSSGGRAGVAGWRFRATAEFKLQKSGSRRHASKADKPKLHKAPVAQDISSATSAGQQHLQNSRAAAGQHHQALRPPRPAAAWPAAPRPPLCVSKCLSSALAEAARPGLGRRPPPGQCAAAAPPA